MSDRAEIETPTGPAWADIDAVRGPKGVLLLGHGAGGSVDAPDLLAVTAAALAGGWTVARITQPYRVAGRRAPAPAAQLDAAWVTVVAALRARRGWKRLPFVYAGRSSGARVACRCAARAEPGGPVAVIALAFPVHPPGRPDKSRLDELEDVGVPVLVVQGRNDAFGRPPESMFDDANRWLVLVDGDHSLKRDPGPVAVAVGEFLDDLG